MQLSDISYWGVALLLLLCAAVAALFLVVSRPTMQRLVRASVRMVLSMAGLAACLWLVSRLNAWWAYGLWTLAVAAAVAFFTLKKTRQPLAPLWPAALLAVLSGEVVGGGCLLLCLGGGDRGLVFLAVVALMAAGLLSGLPVVLQTFLSSLRHTQAHYLYLQANGATHLEAMMPTVRRSLRAALLPSLQQWVKPLLVAPPLLLCGLLLSGASPLAAVLAAVLALLAAALGNVVATVVMLWVADRMLFDRQGMLKA